MADTPKYKRRKTTTCRHCGAEVHGSGSVKHEKSCLHGPMGERLRRFLRDHAIDGLMMGIREYRRRAEPGMPSYRTITRQLGNWGEDVAAWAGLRYDPSTRLAAARSRLLEETVAQMDAIFERTREGAENAEDAYPPLPGKRKETTIYDWRTRSERQVIAYELR